jgi:DNA-binding CsgD family transcriptional regulator
VQLLERETHLAALDDRLAEVGSTRHGRLVLISGEAGVGKTALVRAFAERQPAVAVLTGGCEPLFTPRPLGPFLDVAAQVGGELAAVADGNASPGQVLAALGRSLRGPSVLVLEDLHWADEATLDVLRLLGRRVEGMPALVLVTYRDDELAQHHPLRLALGELTAAERIGVQPLSRDAVAQLAAGHAVDGAALHRRTAGNPFFVSEVLAQGDHGTPASVRDAVLARAARLPPQARALLEAVAVARPRAEIWLLERIAADALSETEACLASGMLRSEGDAVAFRHEIARATIEDAMAPHRRVALHRAALRALVGRGEPARLAHHAEAAGDRAAVLEYAQAAGTRAARLGAHREAAAHFAAALRHGDGLPVGARAVLCERRAQACFLSGMIGAAIEAETEALEIHARSGDRLREGEARLRLARYAWYEGDGARVVREQAQAVELLEALPPGRELALGYAYRATPAMMDYDIAGARAWGERAIDLAQRLGDTEVLVLAMRNIATAELSHGLVEGRDKLQRSLELALEAGLVSHVAVAHCNLVASSHEARDYDAATAHLAQGRVYCSDHDLLSWGTYLDGWEARIALDQCRWDEAEALARSCLERTGGSLPHSRFVPLLVLGALHARRGDEDPWPALDEALRIAVATDELQRLAPIAAIRAEARWLAGEVDEIDAETRDALGRARASDHRWSIGQLEIWRHRAGLPRPVDDDLPPPHRAELGGDHQAAAAFWSLRGCRYDAALALAAGDAEDVLRRALSELQTLDARAAAARVARRLRERGARGVRLGPRAATRANPAGLTRRQLEVLALVRRGHRNAEIAAELFLSEKTVDHHVSAILGKLGVRTRGQAAAEAARLGIGGR